MDFEKRNFFRKTVLLFFLSTVYAAFAAQPSIVTPGYLWVATISGGPIWESGGQTQTFFLQPDVEKTYAARSKSHTLAQGEVFVGVQRTLHPRLQGQLGFSVSTTSVANLAGNVWDDADPSFNNFTYAYKIRHTHVALKGVLLTDMRFFALKPYVSASIGPGFNQAYHYSNTPTISEAVATPNFASNTSTSFTYTVGVGVRRALNTHWQAGVGYEFADWGSSQLGRALGQTMGDGLRLNHLYTNGLLFNLTWLS